MSVVTASSGPVVPARLRRGDHEFLPSALEILETPLSPVRSSLILTICAFVVAAVLLCYFGQVDVIATAQGKIQPVGRTKTIQPVETGKVLRVAVENGRAVQAGDLLLELDASESKADEATLEGDLVAYGAEAFRRRIALDLGKKGVADPTLPLAWDTTTPVDVADRETRVLVDDLAQLASRIAEIEARRQQTVAQILRLKGTLRAQESLVTTLKDRVDMRAELFGRNADSKASVIDAQESYGVQATTLASIRGQLGEAEAALAVAGREIEQTRSAFLSENAEKLAEAERRVADDDKKLAKARVRTGNLQLRSPIDGMVEGLTVTTAGQVVTSGEQVMQIVPAHAAIEVECYLPNGDAGFVKPGQHAVLKLQSFPFTDYGTIAASVTRVAKDAIPMVEAEQHEENPVQSKRGSTFGGAERLQNLVFPVTLTPEVNTIKADGANRLLTPGMAVTVEIKTRSRRILSFLLAPLIETVTTALRER